MTTIASITLLNFCAIKIQIGIFVHGEVHHVIDALTRSEQSLELLLY